MYEDNNSQLVLIDTIGAGAFGQVNCYYDLEKTILSYQKIRQKRRLRQRILSIRIHKVTRNKQHIFRPNRGLRTRVVYYHEKRAGRLPKIHRTQK